MCKSKVWYKSKKKRGRKSDIERECIKARIERIGASDTLWLKCSQCGETWSPNLQRGKLPQDWRLCPNGCNRDKGE